MEVVGPHVAFDVVSTGRWPMGDCVDSIIQSATPWVADGGDALVTLGHVGKGRIEADLVQVWDAATGTPRHRYVFDGRTRIFGFRGDGRVVVRVEKTWFALGVGPSYDEPQLLTEEEARALQASGVLEPFLEPAGMWP